jgi:tRNA G18 (ribose-2'-O)-methylase SpoU
MLIEINDPDDPRLEPYRDVRERDLVGREGMFIAEGEVVLRILLTRSRFDVASVLLLESRARALGTLLNAQCADVPVYTVTRAVMDRIAGFPIHRGVLALGLTSVAPQASAILHDLPAQSLVLGLVGLSNHDNVGGIFRNAAAFGAGAVILDRTTCDPLYRKAIRVSVGAALTVPFARVDSPEGMLDTLSAAGFEVLALSPGGRESLTQTRRAPRTALLVGAEGPGLPASLMSRVRSVAIPMAPGFDSLNVSTATGIALHHLSTI